MSRLHWYCETHGIRYEERYRGNEPNIVLEETEAIMSWLMQNAYTWQRLDGKLWVKLKKNEGFGDTPLWLTNVN